MVCRTHRCELSASTSLIWVEQKLSVQWSYSRMGSRRKPTIASSTSPTPQTTPTQLHSSFVDELPDLTKTPMTKRMGSLILLGSSSSMAVDHRSRPQQGPYAKAGTNTFLCAASPSVSKKCGYRVTPFRLFCLETQTRSFCFNAFAMKRTALPSRSSAQSENQTSSRSCQTSPASVHLVSPHF